MAEYLKRALAARQPADPAARQGLVRALAERQRMGAVLGALSGGEAGRSLQGGMDPMQYAMGSVQDDQQLARENAMMERQAEQDAAQSQYRQDSLDVARQKAANTGAGKPFNVTAGERNSLRQSRAMRDNMGSLVGRFKPDYAQGAIPGQRRLSNYFAGEWGIGSDEAKDAQGWWADWQSMYELPERNEQFGATLTPMERQAWKEANIHGEQDPAQIQRKLGVINQIMQDAAQRDAQVFLDSNLPDNAYGAVFSDVLGQPSSSQPKTMGKYEIISVE